MGNEAGKLRCLQTTAELRALRQLLLLSSKQELLYGEKMFNDDSGGCLLIMYANIVYQLFEI